ncbi:hypothetical protein VTJ83DRAFT_1715 [Remersonia thermophila]|uniref:RNA-directed RNA polymerase n=1 Tax=Remersonia thermophila TaxID=72144 RepID=A0ABR4DGY8_9PEZI
MARPGVGNFIQLLLKQQSDEQHREPPPSRTPQHPGNQTHRVERPPGRRMGNHTVYGSSHSLIIPSHWASQRSVTVVLKPIPPGATPWDIRRFLQLYGNVHTVDFFYSGRYSSIKVCFEPPPTDLSFFQLGCCKLSINGTQNLVTIEFPPHSDQAPTIKTPLGNTSPTAVLLRPQRLAFGVMTRPASFMPKKEIPRLGSDLTFVVDLRRMEFIIRFPVMIEGKQQHYKLDIKFGIIRRLSRTTYEGRSAIVIALSDPPIVTRKEEHGNAADPGRPAWRELWKRAVEVGPASSTPPSTPISLVDDDRVVDFGRWTTYWLDLDQPAKEKWLAVESCLPDWNLFPMTNVSFTRIPNRTPELWSLLADPDPILNDNQALLSPASSISLPFDVRYQLEVCISRGIFSEYEIGRDFLGKLVELSRCDSGFSRARAVLEYAADQGHPIHDPMSLFENRAAMAYYPASLHMPSYCALMRKVTITPTRIEFSTPTVETTNRIIRRYYSVRDNFIRVQFTDELTEGRLRSSGRDDDPFLRVFRAMLHGIRIGRWHWRLVAYGNSQLREHSAFFFCEPDDGSVTCDSIREWMGNFDHIVSVPKVAARLGLAFSSTRPLSRITSPSIIKINDIESNGFCFTDGVGKISPTLARLISLDWDIIHTPSAFQFRMGGCKGVLVTWPDAKGIEVHVRPSQEKFPASFHGLEIIRCSQFASATLNRQIILLLSSLGIPDEVFINMMATQIANHEAAMTDEEKAVELLTKFVDENMISSIMVTMILHGFMRSREPFFMGLLQNLKSWLVKGLREKARLVVEQGAFVLGCVDETGTLRGHFDKAEGKLPQIFLQIPDDDGGAYRVITGKCLVGRNPSLHPGDLRIVEAVDVPQLRHLYNVVVFPLTGDRDIPSMCSGGDLDGDDFFVIWDPNLIPSGPVPEPMSFAAAEPVVKVENGGISTLSLAGFFVLFMIKDNLPLIAHAHLATADASLDGAWDPRCLDLAELHSAAVDAVKTGRWAVFDKRLEPRRYPHFMEKPRAKTYRSTKVLGKLYDMVGKETFDNTENYKLPFDKRLLKRYTLDNALLREARKIKTQYDIAMRRIMGQLEIRTEQEVWTAFVMTRPRVGSDYKVQEKVGREAATLKKRFREMCLKTVADGGFDKLQFVAAMYRVTWEEMSIALHEVRQPYLRPDGTVGRRRITPRSMPLISFPWLFPHELGCVALGTEEPPTKPSLLSMARSWVAPSDIETGGDEDVEDEESTLMSLGGMNYTKTSDGQYIHHGEILQLFQHQDEDEEAFYGGHGGGLEDDKDVEAGLSDVSVDTETASEEAEPEENPPTGQKSNAGLPLLVDLGTALGGIDDGTVKPSGNGGGALGLSGGIADLADIDPSFWGQATVPQDGGTLDETMATAALVSVSTAAAPAAVDTPTRNGQKARSATKFSTTLNTAIDATRTSLGAPASATSARAADENDTVTAPLEYIPVVSLGDGRYGYSVKPMSAAELWGCEGRNGEIGPDPEEGGCREPSPSHSDSQSPSKRVSSDTNWDAESGSEESMVFEEDVVETAEESALERAARFGG